MIYFIVALVLLSCPALAQRKTGNPLHHLPANIEILTHFGERAEISAASPLSGASSKPCR
jgi:hypothetical protein